ncbi:hypothetical protein DM877_05555 [Enterobacter cloacae]|uniref:Uncharacterized protein n=2 Tax=Enterobacter cloacae TaxID=550 RepID=A0A4Q2EB04_ENTCL|nr:hypothetical protein DM877_05555 [Enterobacter cloacae]
MRIGDPWRKKMLAIINIQGRKITAVIKQQFAIYSGKVFHKSVINLTHNDAALQTCNLNKIRQGKVWRDVFWS